MAWSQWAESLKRLKLEGFALWLLESGAPLTMLGAQLIYVVQPFVGGKDSTAIAQMLENDDDMQGFARMLRGERAQ